jgi:hypothetical protein
MIDALLAYTSLSRLRLNYGIFRKWFTRESLSCSKICPMKKSWSYPDYLANALAN